jgi:CheY-like chemotaxis protein
LPSGSRRVLVVDDNRDSADTMAALLGAWGHEVRCAHRGVEALSLAAEYRCQYAALVEAEPVKS